MDLIYMNENREDVGVMQDYTFDLAYGFDENNFELKTNTGNHVCRAGYILYIEGTEYGGIIDRMRVKTSNDELVYSGRTWHGILQSKILQPDDGEDYLTLTGDVNEVLSELIERMGLKAMFTAKKTPSGITIKNYQLDRYITGYDGIKKMLTSIGAKLKMNFQDGLVMLYAEALVDYSKDDEFDSSQIDFDVEKNYKPVNHVICLGRGELKDRTVLHLYADAEGKISHTQSQFGIDEIVEKYENINVESIEELEKGGEETLKEAWNTDALQVNFDSTKMYDIGDIVGARENTTGIFMAKPIIKKIVTIKNDLVTVSHKVGE